VLRLAPIYFVVLFVYMTVFHRHFFGNPLAVLNQMLLLPATLWRNITLDMKVDANPLLLGPCYTVGLEMMFYLIAPFLVRRSIYLLATIWALSFIVHIVPAWFGLEPRRWQYDFFPSTLVFFLSGCLSYRLYTCSERWRYPSWLGYMLPMLFVGFCLWQPPYWSITAEPVVIILLYALVAVGTPFLFRACRHSKIDRFFGDLSYPVYVVHPVILYMLISPATLATPSTPFSVLLGFSLLLIALTSIVLLIEVDWPIGRLRAFSRLCGDLDIEAAHRRTLPLKVRFLRGLTLGDFFTLRWRPALQPVSSRSRVPGRLPA
jgi:peptidoglycan/LPS O-acetylase OafA/YrhL